MDKPSNIRRGQKSGVRQRVTGEGQREGGKKIKAKQQKKQREPTYPVFGLHMEWEGGDKKEAEGRWQNNKETEWTELHGSKKKNDICSIFAQN